MHTNKSAHNNFLDFFYGFISELHVLIGFLIFLINAFVCAYFEIDNSISILILLGYVMTTLGDCIFTIMAIFCFKRQKELKRMLLSLLGSSLLSFILLLISFLTLKYSYLYYSTSDYIFPIWIIKVITVTLFFSSLLSIFLKNKNSLSSELRNSETVCLEIPQLNSLTKLKFFIFTVILPTIGVCILVFNLML